MHSIIYTCIDILCSGLKGIESFDYNKNLNILVTGSLDHMVRIWNPVVTNKPMAFLDGHATGVIGVVIHEGLVQIFSYSKRRSKLRY